MIIAGGSYIEYCHHPYSRRLFGSGLRAALALQKLSPKTSLFTYAPLTYKADVEATLAAAGLRGHVQDSPSEMLFEWAHPWELLDRPNQASPPLPPLVVAGDNLLRFGMLEGSARTAGRRTVYAPQNETWGFFANGSTAKELVMVLSERELGDFFENQPSIAKTLDDRLALLFQDDRHVECDLFAVLLRDKAGDVTLYRSASQQLKIASYASESYFKIGEGDILAAAFAQAWLEEGLDLEDAADRAARSVAWFVEDARLPLPVHSHLPSRKVPATPEQVRIYVSQSLEMGQLLARTLDLCAARSIEATFEVMGDERGSPDVPVLVLLGSRISLQEVEEMRHRVARAPQVVVFANDFPYAREVFPSARIATDYASALYHLWRGSAL